MILTVYKGFEIEFLQQIQDKPLLENDIYCKIDVINFNKNYRKQLAIALWSLKEDDSVWITYEEYSLIYKNVEDLMIEDDLTLKIIKNNLYPEYYPIEFTISNNLALEIEDALSKSLIKTLNKDCDNYLKVYNSLSKINNKYYGSFYNYEYDYRDNVICQNFYPYEINMDILCNNIDYTLSINEDIEMYLRELDRIKKVHPSKIGFNSTKGEVAKRIQKSLQAYCVYNGISLVYYHEKLQEEIQLEEELKYIANNDIHINGFEKFRDILFYKNPDINKELIELSQVNIMEEIIRQAENAYNDETGNTFRDIFITASTGAGKSIMFQIPAVYLAKKYNKLTIIIEPVKALMQDQKEKLIKNGYTRVETFNSDLISQVEKEAVLKKVKNGEVDLLYLSPETLLSYSIENIIGEREIGLMIVDEAHIVTTWGVGFRPDYWYLGSYIYSLRNKIQTHKKMERKIYHFPICAFTATAINGGEDDSVSDTIISLYMENPVKYIGYVCRKDIKFEIVNYYPGKKLPRNEYDKEKTKVLNERIAHWLNNNEKTITYFPYASLVNNASKGTKGFVGIITDDRIGKYTGRNIDDLKLDAFSNYKQQVFNDFREGKKPVIFATKAFGMGIDVNDVKNVYHYAISGNLCDYVQEIGRVARKQDMIGTAITDFFYNDMSYMRTLFGMSQIRQYQIKEVLEGIYDTYKNKNESRNFLITPQSFTYIFNGKNEGDCINKLKTCLLMIEKDFYDKYNFKVLISRPQSVFTKAFICVSKDYEDKVLNSEYGKYMKYIEKGRYKEVQKDNVVLSDVGDVYSIDLKEIWEKFHPNISFPQFKYYYFNTEAAKFNKVNIMPSIRQYIYPRQRVKIETRGDFLLSNIQEMILNDFEYISDLLHVNFRRNYFTLEDFIKKIQEKYGNTKARIIGNSLFELADPDHKCIKKRINDSTGKMYYSIVYGNLKEILRRPIIKSKIMYLISNSNDAKSYSRYMDLSKDHLSSRALKLLSIFDYITYEISGGEEPEIFIRLNDPNKVKNIVLGNIKYKNEYVVKARKKNERDNAILLKFFNDLQSDEERWEYIEDYFLGKDVLENKEDNIDFSTTDY